MPRTFVSLALSMLACGGGGRPVQVDIAPVKPSATAAALVHAPVSVSTVVSGIHPISLAADRTSVYWVEASDQTIRRVNIRGGTPITLATADNPSSIAVGPTEAYWIDDPGKSLVRAVPIGGGTVRDIATDEHLKIWGLATDAASVYHADYFTITATPFDASQPTRTLSCAEGIMRIAVGRTHVACVGVLAKTVAAVPQTGGKARVLAPMNDTPSLAIDDASVYWVDASKSLVRADLGGGPARTISTDVTLQNPLVTIDGHVIVARSDGAILSVPREGGHPDVVAPPRDSKTVVAFTVGAGVVYAAVENAAGEDSILRIAR